VVDIATHISNYVKNVIVSEFLHEGKLPKGIFSSRKRYSGYLYIGNDGGDGFGGV
jgi:hypothetical protein